MDLPKVGSEIYVPTSCFCFIQHPEKDVEGGLAKITVVEESTGLVSLEEIPDLRFNWQAISEEQEKLRQEFGDRRAFPIPQSG
jgi:hypothetical protein